MKKINYLLLFTCILLSACLVLVGCNSDNGSDNNDSGDNGSAENSDISYTVTVKDVFGNPVSDIVVKLMQNGESVKMKMTGADGTVSGTVENGEYTLELARPDSKPLYYDSAVLNAATPEITLTLFDAPGTNGKEHLTFGFDYTGTQADAYILTKGGYRVELFEGKNYFIFVAQERGEYLISTEFSENVNLSYHGGVFYVQENDVSSTDATAEVVKSDAGITFKIRSFNVGETVDSSSKYVISIESDKATSGALIIKHVGDLPFSAEEMPWQEAPITGTPEKLVLAPEGESVVLTDFDITDPTLTWVYSEADGYYHLGDENGPILYMRLNSSSKYAVSLAEICETNGYGVYIYDENGEFVEKRSYSDLFSAYSEAADDSTGVYPVTRDLYEFVMSYGAHNGWWEISAELNRFFGELAPRIIKENAWAFAVCYVA